MFGHFGIEYLSTTIIRTMSCLDTGLRFIYSRFLKHDGAYSF